MVILNLKSVISTSTYNVSVMEEVKQEILKTKSDMYTVGEVKVE